MVNSNMLNWVRSEEAKGYSSNQLRQYLVQRGYSKEDIDEVLNSSDDNSDKGFNHAVMSYGIDFAIVLYFMMFLFGAELLTISIAMIISSSYLMLIFPGIFVGLSVFYIKEKNVENILKMLLFFSPLGILTLLAIPILSLGYPAVISFMLIYGVISAYSLNKVKIKSSQYLQSGIILSSFLALIYAVNKGLLTLVRQLTEKMEMLSAGGSTSIISSLPEVKIDSDIAFMISFIILSASFILFYLKKEGCETKKIFYYIIPVIIYLVLSALAVQLLTAVIPRA